MENGLGGDPGEYSQKICMKFHAHIAVDVQQFSGHITVRYELLLPLQ